MSGEKSLKKLLKNMEPVLSHEGWVFVTTREPWDMEKNSPLASFREEEGLTLVLSRETADRCHMEYEGVFNCITLKVHSSLEAVGLTAAVSGCLKDRGISANVIAAYYHDHIFVPEEKGREALAALQTLME